MKGCIVAAGILLLVSLLVTVNAIYVAHVSNALERMYRQLPTVPDPATTPPTIQEMADYLDRHEAWLGFSIGFPILDGLDERLSRLAAYAELGDTAEYAAAHAALQSCITDLRRHEGVHMRNVF